MNPERIDPSPAPDGGRPRGARLPLALVLAAAFAGLVALGMATVLTISFVAGRNGTIDLLRAHEELTVTVLETRLRETVDPAAEQIAAVAAVLERNSAISYGRLRIADLLSGAVSVRQIDVASFADPDGVLIRVATGDDGNLLVRIEDRGADLALRAALDEARGRAGGWWEGVRFEAGGAAFVRRQSVWREGRFFGLLTAQIPLRQISAAVARVPGSAGGVGFVLLGRERVLAHPDLISDWASLDRVPALPALDAFPDRVLAAIWNPATNTDTGAGGASFRVVPIDDAIYVFSTRTIYSLGPEPWTIGHHRPAREIAAALDPIRYAALAGLVVLTLAVALAVVLGRMLARPIRRVAAAANEMRSFRFAETERLPRSRLAEIDDQARAFNDMLTALRWFETYVPKTLVRRLVRRAESGELPSVERDVTIFFSDIAGFSMMSERLSASDTAALLNHHIAIVARAIEEADGTVDKFIGDAVMAFWGAPRRQEDHAARAVRAAMAAAGAIIADNAARRAAGQPAIRARIGINSGRVVVGNIGAPGRVNYTIVGDPVNIAERLQELGRDLVRPDEDVIVLLSADTARRLPPGMAVAPAGRFSLRGRAGTIEVYRAAPAPPATAANPEAATRAAVP